ncbi:MAG: hypothetical protein WDA27_11865 [Actinomycetota bacterium]
MTTGSDRHIPRVAGVFVGVVLLMGVLGWGVQRAIQTLARGGVEYSYSTAKNWDQLVWKADAVARARIEKVDEPRWNSVDGDYWDGSDDVTSRQFTDVRLTILHTYLGDLPKGPLTITVFGPASKRYDEEPGIPPSENLSGGFNEGDTHIVLLGRLEYGWEDGLREVWSLAAHFEGNWRLDGSRIAGGSALSRSLNADGLIGELREVWGQRPKAAGSPVT